jgi:signal transduction histidine kinase
MYCRKILNVSQESWDSADRPALYKLILFKALMLALALPTIPPILRKIWTGLPFAAVDGAHGIAFTASLLGFIFITKIRQITLIAHLTLAAFMTILTGTMMVSPYGDISSGYHYFAPIILAVALYLGIRWAIIYTAFIITLFLSFSFQLWQKLGFDIVPRLSSERHAVYLDRMIECLIALAISITFYKIFKAQKQELKEREKLLADRDKLNYIERLVEGIAHEINNPLTIAMSNIEIITSADVSDIPALRVRLMRIIDACRRISIIVKSLHEINRFHENPDAPIAIDGLIRDIVQRLSADCGKLTDFHLDLPNDILIVAPFNSLRHIFEAITLNAIEATRPSTPAVVRWTYKLTNSALLLVCEDNGPDYDPELIQNFTAPFYTTKMDVAGRGLGLTLTQTFITRLEGSLSLTREDGMTRVVIEIPSRMLKIDSSLASPSLPPSMSSML